jgi:hypothetical protein
VKKVKAAPAAKTPLRSVSQEIGLPFQMPQCRVWYALRTDPANKHASAMRKVNLQTKHIIGEISEGKSYWYDQDGIVEANEAYYR